MIEPRHFFISPEEPRIQLLSFTHEHGIIDYHATLLKLILLMASFTFVWGSHRLLFLDISLVHDYHFDTEANSTELNDIAFLDSHGVLSLLVCVGFELDDSPSSISMVLKRVILQGFGMENPILATFKDQ